MSEVFTQEIHLRPRSPRAVYVAGGVGAIALVMVLISSGGGERVAPAQVAPKGDAPIVIHATREQQQELTSAVVDRDAPAIASGNGKLKLDSDPRVFVFEGERRLGRTPCELTLPAGSHELRFVDKAKHLEVKRRLEVRANGTAKRELSFGVGALRVRAPSGTKLWLNKKYAGSAPFKRLELAEGRHRIKLKKGGEVVEETIFVPPSQTVDYKVNFAE